MTVKELRKLIKELFCDKSVTNIYLFVTEDQIGSQKDVSVGEILSDGQTACYLEDKCNYSVGLLVKNGDVEIGKVYGDRKDTVKMVK